MIVTCSSCKKKLSFGDEHAGKKVRCPSCKHVFQVAQAEADDFLASVPSTPSSQEVFLDAIAVTEDRVDLRCRCEKLIRVAGDTRGKAVRCPQCQAAIRVPKLPVATLIPEEPALSSTSIWDQLPEEKAPASYPGLPSGEDSSRGYDRFAGASSDAVLRGGLRRASPFSFWKALVTGNERYTGICFVLLVFAPLFGFGGLRSNQLHQEIADRGVATLGTLESGLEKTGRYGVKTYSFKVTYRTPKGESLTQDFQVSSDYFRKHIDGQFVALAKIEVKYLPEKPSSAILTEGSQNLGIMLPLAIVGFLAGLGGLAYRVLWHWQQQD